MFITKMPIIRIKDLAEVMISEMASRFGHDASNIAIETIGTKPGEKMYEELMNLEETRRSVELPKYFAVLPAFRGIYRDIDYRYQDTVSEVVTNPYSSEDETALNQDELRDFLIKNNLLTPLEGKEHPDKRYWPGEREDEQ